MSAIGNLVVNDGQASPVATTFVPTSKGFGNTTEFTYRHPTVNGADTRISYTFNRASNARKADHVRLIEVFPVTGTVDGVEQVIGESRVNVDFYVNQKMTLAQRKNMLAFIANALDVAMVKDSINNKETIF